MTLNATGRKVLSSLLKNADKFEAENAVDTYFTTVSCKAASATDVEPIGTILKYNATAGYWYIYAQEDDWEASATYALGAIVKPTTLNGLEYICITAGDSDATEPTWPLVPGATETETAGVVWLARIPGAKDINSSLPDGSIYAVTVGSAEGIGFNKADVEFSTTAVKMTVLFRGFAALNTDSLEWADAVAAGNKTEVKKALEMNNIVMVDTATAVVPTML